MNKTELKKQIKTDFLAIYGKNCKVLAVQLNGFSHKVFYANKQGNMIIEEYSPWTTMQRQTSECVQLLNKYPTYVFKGNPLEIVFVMPKGGK